MSLALAFIHAGMALVDLEENIQFLNQQYSQSIMVVETSYQAEGTPPDYCVLSEEELPFPLPSRGKQIICRRFTIYFNPMIM